MMKQNKFRTLLAAVLAGVFLGFLINTVVIVPIANHIADYIIKTASEKPSVAVEANTRTEVLTSTESTTEGQRRTRKGKVFNWIDLGTFRITAYCPCEKCSDSYGRITSTGATARAGYTVAVDPTVIPYGTEVIIDNHVYRAQDCGGSIKGNRIDIFFDTHEEAVNFGVQYKEVHIWDGQK